MTATEGMTDKTTEGGAECWRAKLEIEGHQLKMQINAGVAESLLLHKTYMKLKTSQPLAKTDPKFQLYTSHPTDVEGRITLPTHYKMKTVNIQHYVVDVDQRLLLSGQASIALGFIGRVNGVKELTQQLDKFPEVKSSTPTLPGSLHAQNILRSDPSCPQPYT